MKEITLKVGNVWTMITAIIVTAILCGSAIYIAMQFNKTQWDIANTQAEATKQAGRDIGSGVCRSGSSFCDY